MRIFFVPVLFIIAFTLFAKNVLAGVNLTSDSTGVAQATGPPAVLATSQPQVITIQESPATTGQSIKVVLLTSSCANS